MTKALTYAVIRSTAKFYNAAKGNVVHASAAAGVKRDTFKSRVLNAKQSNPEFFKTFEAAKGGISVDAAAQAATWIAFQEYAFNRTSAAKSLGLSLEAFGKRLSVYARAHGIDLTLLKQPEPTVQEAVVSHRQRVQDTASRAKLKDAATIISDLEDRIKELEWAAAASYEPADWTLKVHDNKPREHIPYLLTSDFQIGEVIRAEETETGYGYDSEIFRSRYRRLIDTTIYLSLQHGGKAWTYPGIIYARGGDTISGAIHDELKETDDLTPIEAVECAFEEESAGIYKLAEAFGKVEVKTPGSAGNHDRNLLKPTTKKASAHSYDRLIAYMLRREFNTDKRVSFQTSKSFDVRFPIYDKQILLTHGDRMGSGGGQGFIGPMATIMRGVQKVIMEQAALGFHIDRVDHGHFHTPGYQDFVLSNGCLPGYSEYAKSFRMRPSLPQQMLLYHHKKLGMVDLKPIVLVE